MTEQPSDRPLILIVDDVPENLRMLMETLGGGVYRFAPARSGESALEKAEGGGLPDLVLLDIRMPGMDGYEVLARLKRDPRLQSIPVILISAMSEAAEGAKGFHLGAVDYITKPFIPEVVRARVAPHVELKRKTDLLKKLAATDHLTGLLNRRETDRILESEYRRSVRSGGPISLAFIDIDHFKRFNDAYGHSTGDDCLRTVTAAIRKKMKRPTDVLGRYGGEEFVAILPGTAETGVLRVALQSVEAVAGLRIPHRDSPTAPYVTVSIGAATIRPGKESPTVQSLLEAADKMLYAAKQGGRNRACAVRLTGDGRLHRTGA